jgi:hypothetical protein
MGGQSSATSEIAPPVAAQPMPSSITPQYMQSISGGPPQVDPLSYSDPTNMPDPLIEAIKGIAGMMGYGPNAAPKSVPKRR